MIKNRIYFIVEKIKILLMNNRWKDYIDKTISQRLEDLHILTKLLWYRKKVKNERALSLGTGAGNEEIDLIKNGWEVTGIDIEPHSLTVVSERIKGMSGKFIFQQSSFNNMILEGQYDYVMAFNSLPFSKKEYLKGIIDNVYQHMKPNAVITINMFGNKHSFVKKGSAIGITISEMKELFKDFEILYLNHQQYTRKDGVVWSTIDLIAIKK